MARNGALQAISLLSKLIELEPTNERNFYKVRPSCSCASAALTGDGSDCGDSLVCV